MTMNGCRSAMLTNGRYNSSACNFFHDMSYAHPVLCWPAARKLPQWQAKHSSQRPARARGVPLR
jgi:hypothetical protein